MERHATGVTGGPERGPLSPCVCSTLRMVSRAVTQLYDDILRPSGLRVTQFSILATIARRGLVKKCVNEIRRRCPQRVGSQHALR
jgi:hypothetical protein